jgi:hypothetical protein
MKKTKGLHNFFGNLETPSHYVSSLRKILQKDEEMKGMKSHDYHIMM